MWAKGVTVSVMTPQGSSISRRQLLIAGGGGAALLYAARGALLAGRPGPLAGAPPEAAAGLAPGLRALPFADDFANPALPGWDVRRPVAILGATAFGFTHPMSTTLDRTDVLAGRGTVIGLDGPLAGSSVPGLMETTEAFVFEPDVAHALRFRVAGSHQRADRLPASTVTASLPGLGISSQVTRRPGDGFLEFELAVPRQETAKMSTIVFRSENAPGQAGLLLESVSLDRLGAAQ